MNVYEDQEFHSFDDRDSGAVFADIEFRRCYFEGCGISITRKTALRSTIRNVRLVDCSQRGCTLRTALVEDVIVDGFKTNGQLFQAWGAAFKHVVLRGKIDRLMISSDVSAGIATNEEQRAFDEANAAYFRNVDWALDIREAEFKELCIRGFPGHLVRRDAETQVIVKRERALDGVWKSLDFRENLWRTSLGLFLDRGEADIVLVAGKRHPKFRNYVEDLKLLRKAGVAEPD